MKHSLTKVSLITLMAIILSVSPLFFFSVQAQSTLYIESTNTNPSSGQLFSVNVKASSPNQSFNTALISINYSNLEFVALDFESYVLPNDVPAGDSNYNDGSITKNLYSTPGGPEAIGEVTIMNIAFRAKSSNGSVILNSNSKIIGEVNNEGGKTIAQGGNSLNINVKKTSTTSPTNNNLPKPAPIEQDQKQPLPSRSTPIPPQNPTNIEAQVQAKSSDKTKPKIIEISHSGFIDDNISVKIKTDEGTKATVLSGYSIDSLLLKNLSSGGLKKSYFVSLGGLSQSIEENKPFFYIVEVADAAGNKTVSDVRQISTTGLELSISLKNPDGTPIKNQEFTINGKIFKSDNSGIVNLKNVVPGSVNISYINPDGEEVFLGELTAIEGVSDQVLGLVTTQDIEDGSPITLQNAMPIISALIGVIAIYILLSLINKKRRAIKETRLHTANPYGNSHKPHLEPQGTASNPASTVIKPTSSSNNLTKQKEPTSTNIAGNQMPPEPVKDHESAPASPAPQSAEKEVGVEQAKTIVGNAINETDKK